MKNISKVLKYAIFGALATGKKQVEIKKFYADLRSRGIDAPHPNTVTNYAKQYSALTPEDKKKIQKYSKEIQKEHGIDDIDEIFKKINKNIKLDKTLQIF